MDLPIFSLSKRKVKQLRQLRDCDLSRDLHGMSFCSELRRHIP